MTGGALYYWRRDVEADVRIVMRAEGLTDLSIPACKTWARCFIRRFFPWWEPGDSLSGQQRQIVGAAFECNLARAKHARDKLAWQDK